MGTGVGIARHQDQIAGTSGTDGSDGGVGIGQPLAGRQVVGFIDQTEPHRGLVTEDMLKVSIAQARARRALSDLRAFDRICTPALHDRSNPPSIATRHPSMKLPFSSRKEPKCSSATRSCIR